MSTFPVTPVHRMPPDKMSSCEEEHRRQGEHVFAENPPERALNADLEKRFRELLDDVTEQLMQDGNVDRATCRADAVTLLIEAARQLEPDAPEGESPLTYLLLEERQKARAALTKTEPCVALPTLIRA